MTELFDEMSDMLGLDPDSASAFSDVASMLCTAWGDASKAGSDGVGGDHPSDSDDEPPGDKEDVTTTFDFAEES